MEGAVVSSANYTPLTPISFLERSSLVYADRTSIVHGRTSYTWRQTRDRCLMLGSALTQLGLDRHNVVEGVIYSHPAVLEAAVVGRPDNYWGETPCAFVKLKEGHDATGEEIIQFCRGKLPHYMAPRTIVFEQELPKTSTGKIQKFLLRAKAKAMGSLSGPGRSKM